MSPPTRTTSSPSHLRRARSSVWCALVAVGLFVAAASAAAQQAASRTVTLRLPAVPAPEIRCGDMAMYADVTATVVRDAGPLRAGTTFTAHLLNCDALVAGCYEASLTEHDVRAILQYHRAPVRDGLTVRPSACQ